MGKRSRRTRLAACAVAAGAMLSGLAPAAGATVAQAATPSSAASAADDPAPGHEGMPDDGFDEEPEGEQDDFAGAEAGAGAGAGAGAAAAAPSAAPAAPVPGRAADFKLATGADGVGVRARGPLPRARAR
ncbi:hypothetical protein ACFXPY_18085 [Streptomyces sp. NPDC059153]|uniref:hypothetical protein n=1 Tax=Streptomyces sp. NPDC059153 TaxID=3346743 RepID=UPI0036922073